MPSVGCLLLLLSDLFPHASVVTTRNWIASIGFFFQAARRNITSNGWIEPMKINLTSVGLTRPLEVKLGSTRLLKVTR
jgi:hypothetical protein